MLYFLNTFLGVSIHLSLIKIQDICYSYTSYLHNEVTYEIKALDKINLDIKKGEFVTILGTNGSGKSTLAKHINALLKPRNGIVLINDMDSADKSHTIEIRKSIGMIFQNPDNQLIGSTVEEDVAFGLENLGTPASDIRNRVNDSLKSINMFGSLHQDINKLSGGQKQKVAIAGVLAMKPDCIVLDESTSMLDPEGRAQIIDTLSILKTKEKTTIILITHHLEEAIDSDRVIIMKDGQIISQGKPYDILTNTELILQAGLLPTNILEIYNSLKKSGLDLEDKVLTIKEMVGALCLLKSKI
jgi:energy-coupling factor transport system ATP-binding protein